MGSSTKVSTGGGIKPRGFVWVERRIRIQHIKGGIAQLHGLNIRVGIGEPVQWVDGAIGGGLLFDDAPDDT